MTIISGIAIFVVAVGALSAVSADTERSSVPSNRAADILSRPCNSASASTKPSKATNKNKRQRQGGDNGNSPNACIEVRSTAIAVQEYLQAQGREEKWSLSDERVAEDAWIFSRNLQTEELLRFTKRAASTERVNWTSGASFVQVSTVELDDGFVRVQISARFEGYGESEDRFAPPKKSWPLNSNMALEEHLIAVLQNHFKNAT